MNKRQILFHISISVVVLSIVILSTIQVLNQIGEKIEYECGKINYEGTVSFGDADVDCYLFSNLSNITVALSGGIK